MSVSCSERQHSHVAIGFVSFARDWIGRVSCSDGVGMTEVIHSRYRVVDRKGKGCLLQCRLYTGKTHQVDERVMIVM